MKNRIIAAILVITLVLGVYACGNETKENGFAETGTTEVTGETKKEMLETDTEDTTDSDSRQASESMEQVKAMENPKEVTETPAATKQPEVTPTPVPSQPPKTVVTAKPVEVAEQPVVVVTPEPVVEATPEPDPEPVVTPEPEPVATPEPTPEQTYCNFSDHVWTYGKVYEEPTCARDGLADKYCSKCGYAEVGSLPRTDNHSYELINTPDCIDEARYHCSICHDEYRGELGSHVDADNNKECDVCFMELK